MKLVAFEVIAALMCGVVLTILCFSAGAIFSAVVSAFKSVLRSKGNE